jgi:hypothetical protein
MPTLRGGARVFPQISRGEHTIGENAMLSGTLPFGLSAAHGFLEHGM